MDRPVRKIERSIETVELLDGPGVFPARDLGQVILASMAPRTHFDRLNEETQHSYRQQGFRLASLLAARGYVIARVQNGKIIDPTSLATVE